MVSENIVGLDEVSAIGQGIFNFVLIGNMTSPRRGFLFIRVSNNSQIVKTFKFPSTLKEELESATVLLLL